MKSYLTMFFGNMIFVAWEVAVYFFPQYLWSLKWFFYILLPVVILGEAGIILDPKTASKNIQNTANSFWLQFIDHLFDALTIFMLIVLNLKIIFVLYIISVFLTINYRHKIRTEKKEQNEV